MPECASLSVWPIHRLEGGAQSFRYLRQSAVYALEDVDDGEAFRDTLDAMAIVGLSGTERQAVLGVVAAVLHLGNVEFAAGGADDAVYADGASAAAAATAAMLLQVRLQGATAGSVCPPFCLSQLQVRLQGETAGPVCPPFCLSQLQVRLQGNVPPSVFVGEEGGTLANAI
jgi:Myosin head (motor domain)